MTCSICSVPLEKPEERRTVRTRMEPDAPAREIVCCPACAERVNGRFSSPCFSHCFGGFLSEEDIAVQARIKNWLDEKDSLLQETTSTNLLDITCP